MDRLYQESIRLTDFHVDPMCTPTRAALMTGRYSTRVGAWLTYGSRNHLRRDEVTMADVFRRNGYTTAIFGKWHLGDSYPFRPGDRGFDESFVHGGGVIGEAPDYWGNDYYDDTYFRNGGPERAKGYCTDVWFDEAIQFVENKRRQPFFLYIPTNAPHGPRHVPKKYVDPYRNNPDINEDRALFYGMIANIDENIARLRESLEASQIAENTILIFLTDNGGTAGARQLRSLTQDKNHVAVDGFNAGMRGNKTSAYEGGHRAACFVHWPQGGFDTGHDIPRLASHFDLLPTLIDLCDLQTSKPLAFDGISLAPLFRGDDSRWPARTLFVHNQGRKGAREVYEGFPIKNKDFCVMTERWRMVGKELYDFRDNPGQTRNVAAQHSDVVEALSRKYEVWWEDVTRRSKEYTPFVVNPARQKTVVLTCQSWHGDTIPYNQQHVRSALKSNGYWMIDVEQPGKYRVELRRWPRESDLAMRDKFEHRMHDPTRYDVNSRLLEPASQTLEIDTARLKVGDFDAESPVTPTDKAARFHVNLATGEQRIQSWFTTRRGEIYGAYYVYIEMVQ